MSGYTAAKTHIQSVDPVLGRVMGKPLKPLTVTTQIYEDTVCHIVGQQISVAAARAVEGRLIALLGGSIPSPAVLRATPVETLRSAGVSGVKAAYIHHVADFFVLHSPAEVATWDQARIKRELIAIKGVGEWTIEMLLIFTLGDPDVFSIRDTGLVNAVVKLYKLRRTKTLHKRILKLSKKWAPYRTTAARHLWQYYDGSFEYDTSIRE